MKGGSYILLIELPEEATIDVGSLKTIHLAHGYYAYVGSAMGGFKSRLNRHLRENKKTHWHIDYLLERSSITGVILCETEHRLECAITQALKKQFDSIPGFGCSDCKCPSHLFYAAEEGPMKSRIVSMISSLGIEPTLQTDLSVITK